VPRLIIQQYLGVREKNDGAGRARGEVLIRGHQGDSVEVVVFLVIFADGNHDFCLLVAVVRAVLL
jgi:hypothetical protein